MRVRLVVGGCEAGRRIRARLAAASVHLATLKRRSQENALSARFAVPTNPILGPLAEIGMQLWNFLSCRRVFGSSQGSFPSSLPSSDTSQLLSGIFYHIVPYPPPKMFKRVAKATSRKVDVNDLKSATGDDTAIGIDQLVDESSSSEGEDSDGDDDDDDSDQEDDDAADEDEDGSAEVDGKDSAKAGSKRKRAKDTEEDEAHEAAAQVSIDDAMQDPIYVPTEGEKKHGVFASRCIVCEAAVLKTPHLVTAHLEGKAHKRRMERFQRYVQDQLSETQRKAIDARDAVDQMDAWRAEQDELEKEKLSQAPPSKRALAKKQKAAEFRQKKKEKALKRKAKKADESDKDTAKEASSEAASAEAKSPSKKAEKDSEEGKTSTVKSPSKKADKNMAKEETNEAKRPSKKVKKNSGEEEVPKVMTPSKQAEKVSAEEKTPKVETPSKKTNADSGEQPTPNARSPRKRSRKSA